MRTGRLIPIAILLFAMLFASAQWVLADPTALPSAGLCQIAPRTQTEIDALVAKGGVSRDNVTLEEAVQASPEVVVEIERTWAELIDCGNRGDFLRVAALFTDEYLATGSLDAAPEVDENGQPISYIDRGVFSVQVLNDGRVGAIVAADGPEAPSPVEPFYAVFRLVGDRWLFDAFPLTFYISFELDEGPTFGYATPVP